MGSCTSATRARTPLAESSWGVATSRARCCRLDSRNMSTGSRVGHKKYPFHDDAGPCLGSAHVRAAFVQACSPRQFVVSCIAERVRLYNHQLLCLPGRTRGTHGMQDFGPGVNLWAGSNISAPQRFSCLLRAPLLPSPRAHARASLVGNARGAACSPAHHRSTADRAGRDDFSRPKAQQSSDPALRCCMPGPESRGAKVQWRRAGHHHAD